MYGRSLYPLAVPGGLPAAVAISAQYRQPHTPPTSGLVTTPSHASYLLVLALSAPCAIATGQNKKTPEPFTPLRVLHGSGAGLCGRWLRRFDIHKRFMPAAFTFARHMVTGCVWCELEDFSFPAHWTDNPSILCD